jgi:hypothetical protein
MTPSSIRQGCFYFTLVGDWTFEVEQIQGNFVLYRVVETRQRCKTTLDDFADRVRPAETP